MIFYHFTDLEALIGLEGREALSKARKDKSDDVDVAGFAGPGSILADGIKPCLGHDDDNFVHLLRRPCHLSSGSLSTLTGSRALDPSGSPSAF